MTNIYNKNKQMNNFIIVDTKSNEATNEKATWEEHTDDANSKSPLSPEMSDIDILEKKGVIRHNAPSTKEWNNSSYSYNKNYEKTLPIANKLVNGFIQSYLNMKRMFNKKRSRLLVRRFRRLSLNQIIVSKGEPKHTNNKVIITVNLYNKNKKFLIYKLKNLYKPVHNLNKRNRRNKTRKVGIKNKIIFAKNSLNYITDTKTTVSRTRKNYKILTSKNPILKTSYLKRKMKFISLRAVKLIKTIKRNNNLISKTLNWEKLDFLRYKNKYYRNFMKKSQKLELLYMVYIKMLTLNNNKFKNGFLLGLNRTVSKLYNKKVEFNFVNLRYLHLNSDIFTQSIVKKIKNRKNPINRVLSKALISAKTPWKNRILSNSIINGISKTYNNMYKLSPFIEDVNATQKSNYDLLQVSLSKLFTLNKDSVLSLARAPYTHNLKSKLVNILDTIRYKTVLGIRLEAAGRLSKRLTASRSLFRLRYKGGIRDTYIEIGDVSSVILRGNVRPNVQYTLVNNKTRNGSFGLKTWINAF